MRRKRAIRTEDNPDTNRCLKRGRRAQPPAQALHRTGPSGLARASGAPLPSGHHLHAVRQRFSRRRVSAQPPAQLIAPEDPFCKAVSTPAVAGRPRDGMRPSIVGSRDTMRRDSAPPAGAARRKETPRHLHRAPCTFPRQHAQRAPNQSRHLVPMQAPGFDRANIDRQPRAMVSSAPSGETGLAICFVA